MSANLESSKDKVQPILGAPRTLGVALSGGGVRASLFALGALMYLVDSKENVRVTEISSVSGGSITNGFVAQRCNFQRVSREQFDLYSSELAKAITFGLVSKRFAVVMYGLLGAGGAAAILVTYLSRPLRSSLWLDVALVALDVSLVMLFGALLLLRGTLLGFLLKRQAFGSSKPTLGSVKSNVAHVFCATDLNASMPIYFTNAGSHFYSPAWGQAEAEMAADITITDAVRASAAFPGGIPPKRLDVEDFKVSPTPIENLQQWQQLAFEEVKQERPTILYLADGGVWNNLGTDWFEHSTRLRILTDADGRSGLSGVDELLVVDASAPTIVKPLLKWFRIPFIAEVLSLFKVLLVSYASTVEARVENLQYEASKPRGGGSRWQRVFLMRLIDPISQATGLGSIIWRGDQGHWSGRWTLRGTLKCLSRGSLPGRRLVVRNFSSLNKWTAWVPTTLFAISPEVAVQLLVHGWFAAAQSMAGAASAVEFSGVERFAKLLGIEAHPLPGLNITILGPASNLPNTLDIIETAILDRKTWTDEIVEIIRAIFIPVGEALEKENRLVVQEIAAFDQKLAADEERDNRLIRNTAAKLRMIKGEYKAALEIFDDLFLNLDLADEEVDPLSLSCYAWSLASTGDKRAGTVTHQAENKMRTQCPRSYNATAAAWWNTAVAYALLDEGENAVSCLRELRSHSPKYARTWLISESNHKDYRFEHIKNCSAFVGFEREMAALPEVLPEDARGSVKPDRTSTSSPPM